MRKTNYSGSLFQQSFFSSVCFWFHFFSLSCFNTKIGRCPRLHYEIFFALSTPLVSISFFIFVKICSFRAGPWNLDFSCSFSLPPPSDVVKQRQDICDKSFVWLRRHFHSYEEKLDLFSLSFLYTFLSLFLCCCCRVKRK